MTKMAHEMFAAILKRKPSIYEETWKDRPFEKIKYLATTEKGNLGEDFLEVVLTELGYTDIELPKGRRGQYDVSVAQHGKRVLFESKVASEDTNGAFQFNGIRYDTRYTHLFCLGVTPEQIYYEIVKKSRLLNDDYTLTPMARGANATFKLTMPVNRMKSFDTFAADVAQALQEVK